MSALYKIGNEYKALMEEGLEPEMIADTLEGIEGEFTDKLEQVISVIKNKQAYEEALKTESKNLADRAKTESNHIESLKKYIIDCMKQLDKSSMQAGIHKVTSRKPQQVVNLIDETKIPDDFCEYETVIKIDKNAIKSKLKAGETVEGAELKLGKPSLTIK